MAVPQGSTEIVTEFFGYSINSILYQRGIYPPESFSRVSKYGLQVLPCPGRLLISKVCPFRLLFSEPFDSAPPRSVHSPTKPDPGSPVRAAVGLEEKTTTHMPPSIPLSAVVAHGQPKPRAVQMLVTSDQGLQQYLQQVLSQLSGAIAASSPSRPEPFHRFSEVKHFISSHLQIKATGREMPTDHLEGWWFGSR